MMVREVIFLSNAFFFALVKIEIWGSPAPGAINLTPTSPKEREPNRDEQMNLEKVRAN